VHLCEGLARAQASAQSAGARAWHRRAWGEEGGDRIAPV
jgi:hypothetical protein